MHEFTVLQRALGQLDRKKIAALARLAPYCCEGEAMKGKRHIWGGRAAVRRALYMATLSAKRHNPAIKAFYNRHIAAGKKAKRACPITTASENVPFRRRHAPPVP